jgi:ubiquinone/menaquinone biosynthesis C-methylase UbiE
MFKNLKQITKSIISNFPSIFVRIEHRKQKYKINERSVEYAFALKCFSEIYPKTLLDVGTGTTAFPSVLRTCGAVVDAIDNIKDYWPSGMTNRHYYVQNADILETILSRKKYDMVTCISVLEHIMDYDKAMRNMVSLLNDRGHLCITFPYTEERYYHNCYDEVGSSYGQDNPYITQSFSRVNIDNWRNQLGLKINKQQYWQMWTGKVWTVGDRVTPPKRVSVNENHQVSTILFQKVM